MADDRDLLIGDAERASATAELREHYEAGRLTLPEFEGRVDTVHAARTQADLREALRQLPSKGLPSLSPRDKRWRSLAVQYVVVNLVAILVWAFSDGPHGAFWPKWVFLVTLVMFVRRVLGSPEHRHRRHRSGTIEPPPPPPPPLGPGD